MHTDWTAIILFITTQCLVGIGILYNRARKDARNDEASQGRFKLNEERIEELKTNAFNRLDNVEGEVKSLHLALTENSILMARIDERTTHMVSSSGRIEKKLDDLNNKNG